jgi:hypothetical protein
MYVVKWWVIIRVNMETRPINRCCLVFSVLAAAYIPKRKKITAKLSLWGKSMAPGDAKKSTVAKYATR